MTTPDLLGAPVFEVKAELFKALAHPVRVRALEVLAEGREHSVGDLAAELGIEAPHLSQQLGILRRAEKRGKTLPPQLARALRAAAGLEQTSTSTED